LLELSKNHRKGIAILYLKSYETTQKYFLEAFSDYWNCVAIIHIYFLVHIYLLLP